MAAPVESGHLGFWLETLGKDLRFGARMLRKSPGFTAVAILTLTLGIGANTAIFTLIDAVLLKSLPVQKPEQLVLFSDGRQWGFVSGIYEHWRIFSYPLYEHFRDHDPSFGGICAFRTELDRLSVRARDTGSNEPPHSAWGRLVSGNYFSVLGVQPVWGRVFTPEDDHPGAAPAAVISYRYWERHFALDRAVIGRTFDVNGIAVTVVGVTPREFFGESVETHAADMWLPVTLQPELMRDRGSLLNIASVNWLNLIGRLKPEVSLRQAQSAAGTELRQFLEDQAGTVVGPNVQRQIQKAYIALVPGGTGASTLRLLYSTPLHILMVAVACVLLIACANVANILLSRGAAREKEISMRLALGAGRGHLIRQMLTESVLLGLLGGTLGVFVSKWGVSVLVAMVAGDVATVPLNVSPDGRILVFMLLISLLTGVLSGLAPALRATQVDLVPVLKGGTPGKGLGGRWNLAKTLVVSQVALSLLLLVGAGLFVRTLQALYTQDMGFRRDHVLEVGIDPHSAGYSPSRLPALYQSLLDRVNALPGVRSATLSLYSPMSGDNWAGAVTVEGYSPPPQKLAGAQWVWVGPRYVETEGMILLAGRDISAQDTANAPKIAVVNESFVRNYIPNQNPIGHRFSMSVPATAYEVEIVGVVKDFKFNEPRQHYWPVVILPIVQSSGPESYAAYLEVRTSGDPAGAASAIRQTIQTTDSNLPVTEIRTLAEQTDQALTKERLIARLSSFLAGLALLLACVGLYGVLAFSVTRRTGEIGIRLALGAQRRQVLAMVLRSALWLVAIGIAIGTAASIGAERFVASELYGLKPSDPVTFLVAVTVLVVVAALAAYLPARRAMRVDPTVALRYE